MLLSIKVSTHNIFVLCHRLKEHSTKVGARAVIMSPTRELSLQTFSVVQKLGYKMGLRTAVLVGGDSMTDQFQQLAANPDILIATPGMGSSICNPILQPSSFCGLIDQLKQQSC